jgi:uncharacterized membrane protein
MRHRTFQSNAMDLGYTDQVVWNTRHGRFMRFSTFQGAIIDLPLDQFRRTDTLLAYHAEFILAPISLLYLGYDSPVTLLVLQTVVLGLGALPAFWLARDRLGSEFAGLVFAAAYLLAPAIEGANMSDFHGVSLTASLLFFAFYYVQARRYRPFFALILLSMSSKEDIPLVVLMMGLYIFFFLREHKVGAITAAMGLGWFLICTLAILPFYNGLPSSPFVHRLTIFGPTLKASLLNILREPALLVRWFTQPEIVAYLGGLLASAGFASLLSPAILAISAPVVAMNVLSTWNWTYSEGAHYSASIVPFVMISGIYGLGYLARQLSQRCRRLPYRWAVNGLAVLVLIISGVHHVQIGLSPLARSFHLPRLTPHHRLAQTFIDRIPPDAPLSAQSSLYPHLAHREKAYFFPAINDAEYILLDVTGTSYPVTTEEVYETVQRLLDAQRFGVLAAQDGVLLLQRGLSGKAEIPASFYTFARTGEHHIAHPLRARFGDTVELLGYEVTIHNTVHAHQLPVTIATYWRPLRPLPAGHSLAFFFTRREDGAIVYLYDGATPATTWVPIDRWQQGEVIRVETPVLSVGRLQHALVAVIPPAGDPWSAADRLQPIVPTGDPPPALFDQETLLKLFAFP